MGTFLHVPRYLAMGCLCVVSDKNPTIIERFGESVLKQAVLSVQKTLPCAAMERCVEWEDLLPCESSFQFIIAIL